MSAGPEMTLWPHDASWTFKSWQKPWLFSQ